MALWERVALAALAAVFALSVFCPMRLRRRASGRQALVSSQGWPIPGLSDAKGLLDMINDKCLNRAASARYLETEAVHDAVNGGDNVVVVGFVSQQIEII